MGNKMPTYTEEQIRILEQNPYTHNVTPYKISFTLEFKEFFISQVNVPGMTLKKIFKAAGYDPKIFSEAMITNARRAILSEASSPEGLKPPRGLSSAEKQLLLQRRTLMHKGPPLQLRSFKTGSFILNNR